MSPLRSPVTVSFCLLLSLTAMAPAVATDAPAPTDSSPVIRELDLATNDLEYDPVSGRIIASLPSRVGSDGNSIVAIDPLTGRISESIFVGSEPGDLDLSDDSTTLYIGLDGSAAVRRFDMVTLQNDIVFPLGEDEFFGPFFPEDIEVPPGFPEALAVSRMNDCCSPRHEGVALYVDGEKRPDETPGHTGSNVIEFSDSPTILYGYNNETTEFGFRTMLVDASGVETIDVAESLITGFGVDIEYDSFNDWIYATSGRVIDPVQTIIVGTIGASGPVEPDAENGLVFYVAGSEVQAFDATTFVPLGSLDIPGMSGSPASLIRWGDRGLAFRTTGDQVFLLSAETLFARMRT
jgi:hypothetical protein